MTSPGNEAVRRLARRFGLALAYRDGTVEGYAPLPAELPAPCRAAALGPRPGA